MENEIMVYICAIGEKNDLNDMIWKVNIDKIFEDIPLVDSVIK